MLVHFTVNEKFNEGRYIKLIDYDDDNIKTNLNNELPYKMYMQNLYGSKKWIQTLYPSYIYSSSSTNSIPDTIYESDYLHVF